MSHTTWVENVGQRALASPSGIQARWRFARLAITATLSLPKARRREVKAQTAEHLWRTGVRQSPLVGFLGLALGLLVVAQAVALLRQVSAQQFMGKLMVTVVMRELGPLLTAFLLAARAGTAIVADLGAMQISGKLSRMEKIGTHTMQELVTPRLRALAAAAFCLTVYLIFVSLASGYLVAFLQNVPLRLDAYCGQLADAMHWLDFVLVGLKAALFGGVIAVVSCYHGLEQLLRIEEFSTAATRAVVESLAVCVLLDAVFLVGYLVR